MNGVLAVTDTDVVFLLNAGPRRGYHIYIYIYTYI